MSSITHDQNVKNNKKLSNMSKMSGNGSITSMMFLFSTIRFSSSRGTQTYVRSHTSSYVDTGYYHIPINDLLDFNSKILPEKSEVFSRTLPC